MIRTIPVSTVVLLGLFAIDARAQSTTAGALPDYRTEFVTQHDIRGDKFVRLAEVMPAALYTWRPAEGVRSVAEVFLHIASTNYSLARFLGAQPPAGFSAQDYESSTTDKATIVAALRDSFAHLRSAALAAPASGDATVNFRGGQPAREYLLFIAGHQGEHLGQSIAYARVNGVVPPWSGE